jgi:hypothetical protein
VAWHAQRLQIRFIVFRTARLARDDVINKGGRRQPAGLSALSAQWLILQMRGADRHPAAAFVEFLIGLAAGRTVVGLLPFTPMLITVTFVHQCPAARMRTGTFRSVWHNLYLSQSTNKIFFTPELWKLRNIGLNQLLTMES